MTIRSSNVQIVKLQRIPIMQVPAKIQRASTRPASVSIRPATARRPYVRRI
jgi:hypothetical protein